VRRGADLAERTQRVLAVIAPAADGVLGPRPLERRPGGRPPRLNSGVRAREAPVECELREGGTPPVRLRRLVAAAFRPTLREELARFPPAGRRAAVAALALLVVALVAAGILASRPGGTHVVHHGRPVYNLFHPGSLRRVAPGSGELLRLEHRDRGALVSRFAVAPLALPAYKGNPGGMLPLLADRELAALRARIPGMEPVEEGKARVNNAAGYMLSFVAGRHPLVYGRLVLLPRPGRHPRRGVRLLLLGTHAGGNALLTDLGNKGELREPFRTFMFGTGIAP
jgi:hypothetical protein